VAATDSKQFAGKSLGDVLAQRHEANTSREHRPTRNLAQANEWSCMCRRGITTLNLHPTRSDWLGLVAA